MQIEKFQSLAQRIQYSKIYRLPKWLLRKFHHSTINPKTEYQVDMRIGHKICIYPTQNYLKNTLISQQYHDENIFFVEQFLSSNPVIIDIGANIGLYTCAYAQYFKKLNPTIFAIEAVDTNYRLLTKNILLNQFQNIYPIHIALGDQTGFVEFSLPSDDFVGNVVGNNVTLTSTPNSAIKKVKLETMDNLAKENCITKCDFMKIDIEGAELFFFKGAAEFIKKTRPVIQFEYNKFWLEKNSIFPEDFEHFFKPLNYTFYKEKSHEFIRIEDLSHAHIEEGLIDLLVVPNEKISERF